MLVLRNDGSMIIDVGDGKLIEKFNYLFGHGRSRYLDFKY